MLTENTKKILEIVEKLYRQESLENGLDKEIGHGIEHIKGVVKRAARISQQVSEDDKDENFDDLVAATAALHDIGNLINREFHNIYSGAFIRNSLKVSDLQMHFNSEKPLQKGKETDAQNAVMLFYLKTHFTKEDISYILGHLEDEKIKDVLDKIANFMYNKEYFNGLKHEMDQKKIRLFLKDTLEQMTSIDASHFLSRKELLIIKQLQEQIDKTFSSKEKEMIIKAVEDHNRDYEINENGLEIESKPKKADNIYGKIVFDADKDDTIETFVIRSYLFVKNELADKLPHVFYDENKNLIESRVIDDILSQLEIRFAPSAENLKNIGYSNADIIPPSFVHGSTADPFSKWKFAKHDKKGNIMCTYNDTLCYISEIKAGEKYTVFSVSDSKPLFDLEVNKDTKIPIIPDDVLLYASLSGGRDVRFQLPLPKDEESLNQRMEFFKKIAFYADDFNYEEAYNFMKGIIEQTKDMSPEEAIDMFETPDSLSQIALKYDAYKVSKDGEYKGISLDTLSTTILPNINQIIIDAKKGKDNYGWNVAKLLYDIDEEVIYAMSKTAEIKTFVVNNKNSNIEDIKSDYIKNLKDEYGDKFISTFKKEIDDCFNEHIYEDIQDADIYSGAFSFASDIFNDINDFKDIKDFDNNDRSDI